MSLRHLYLDLKDLGVYPDLSTTHDKKYYGYKFKMNWSMNECTLQIFLYKTLIAHCEYKLGGNIHIITKSGRDIKTHLNKYDKRDSHESFIDIIMSELNLN